ncbi:MAG: DNA-deoxyinosine glycosylase [Candidatus Rariloculaceae bacterium]
MAPSQSFEPLSAPNAAVLILGSLPGKRSLQEQQYYAQPRNAFWRIMGELFRAGPALPYAERVQRLVDSSIALWDVVASAERPGSLDASIIASSVVVNDFAAFFGRHPKIELVCFNGAKAAELYERRVLPTLDDAAKRTRHERLPSTSPAHAAMRFEEKLACWSVLKQALDGLERGPC